jgi:hypothetical protein
MTEAAKDQGAQFQDNIPCRSSYSHSSSGEACIDNN